MTTHTHNTADRGAVHGTGRARRALAALVAAACASVLLTGLLAGCAGTPAPTDTDARAGAQAAGSGIELRLWVVDPAGTGATEGVARPGLRDVIAQFESATGPLSPATVALWRANGLRVMVIPRAQVDRLGAALNRVGPIQTQWLGENTRWIEGVRGPSWKGRTAVAMDNGQLDLSSGVLRMLLRGWVAPQLEAITDSPEPASDLPLAHAQLAAVQIELLPQFLPLADTRPRPGTFDQPEPRLLEAREEGVVFARLALETRLNPGDALLVVPQRPGDEITPPTDDEPERAPTQEEGRGLGPGAPEPPTLGELMLSDILRPQSRGTRIVLVLVPHAQGEFTLRAY
jgi:hypothetical protein